MGLGKVNIKNIQRRHKKNKLVLHDRRSKTMKKSKGINDTLMAEFIANVFEIIDELYKYNPNIRKAIILYFKKKRIKTLELISFLKRNKISYSYFQKKIINYHYNRLSLKLAGLEICRFILWSSMDEIFYDRAKLTS